MQQIILNVIRSAATARMIRSIWTTVITALCCWRCDAFMPSKAASSIIVFHTKSLFHSDIVLLGAKNTSKGKKRIGGPRGSGGRGKPPKDGVTDEDDDDESRGQVIIPEPTKFRKQIISLPRPEPYPPVRVCIVEVSDVEWWNNENNLNPFGAKLWPSGLAVAQFLANMGSLENYDVLEIGCGNGLSSIVAAESGARVVASDISQTILKLTKIGWIETQKERQKRQQKLNIGKENLENDGEDGASDDKPMGIIQPGSLNTFNLDIFADRLLPMSNSAENKKIVTATAMMYDSEVAKQLAHRAFEACARGAWVILGDDDTGEREGGRKLFISELDKVEKENGKQFSRVWKQSAVKYQPLQWSDKPVKLLHYNAPPGAKLDF